MQISHLLALAAPTPRLDGKVLRSGTPFRLVLKLSPAARDRMAPDFYEVH